MRELDEDAIGKAVSAETSPQLAECIPDCPRIIGKPTRQRLAGAALSSWKFGANAAWLRLNAILYRPLSAYKRVGLPGELQTAGPKRLRFLLSIRSERSSAHARVTLPRTCSPSNAPPLPGFRARRQSAAPKPQV
jgi:hypothetical protein